MLMIVHVDVGNERDRVCWLRCFFSPLRPAAGLTDEKYLEWNNTAGLIGVLTEKVGPRTRDGVVRRLPHHNSTSEISPPQPK